MSTLAEGLRRRTVEELAAVDATHVREVAAVEARLNVLVAGVRRRAEVAEGAVLRPEIDQVGVDAGGQLLAEVDVAQGQRRDVVRNVPPGPRMPVAALPSTDRFSMTVFSFVVAKVKTAPPPDFLTTVRSGWSPVRCAEYARLSAEVMRIGAVRQVDPFRRVDGRLQGVGVVGHAVADRAEVLDRHRVAQLGIDGALDGAGARGGVRAVVGHRVDGFQRVAVAVPADELTGARRRQDEVFRAADGADRHPQQPAEHALQRQPHAVEVAVEGLGQEVAVRLVVDLRAPVR